MKNSKYPLYETDNISTLKELIHHAAETYGEKPAFRILKYMNEAIEISFVELKSNIECLGTYLINEGYKNAHIAVLGENSFDWLLIYFAVSCSGNVIVPIDNDLQIDEVKHILAHSECNLIFYSNNFVKEAEQLRDTGINTINISIISDLIVGGQSLIECGNECYSENVISPKNLSSIIYTSGTTGKPKGVMLSHDNLTFDAVGCCKNVCGSGDTIAVLPFHHTFSLTVGILSTLHSGFCTYICKSVKYFSRDLKTVKPTFLFLVPLVVNVMHRNIWETVKNEGKASQFQQLMRISNALLYIGIDIRQKLFKKVLDAFGGKLEWISCGGSVVNPVVATDFRTWGVNIIEGYGLTECSPCVASNRNKCTHIGSVGTPLDGCSVKIVGFDKCSDGEILVKGQNVMLGYYKNPEATAEAFDGEWFKTGDLGYIDEDGFLYITGRKKNLIILDNGKNVYPEEIEGYLAAIEQIKEAVVYEENKLIAAEIYPDPETDNAEQIIRDRIALLNKTLPIYKQVQSIKFRQTEFEKTTTKKIKRHKVGVNANV